MHCHNCQHYLANNDLLMIGMVPPSQHHLSIKHHCEVTAERTLRKEDVIEETHKKFNRSLFRLLCQRCDVKIGSVELIEGMELMCLKAEAVSIKPPFGVEIHEKKLKKLIPHLEKLGIEKVKLSILQSKDYQCVREVSTPLVYCDISQLSRKEINSFTLQTPRDYQVELFTYSMQGNALVFLPTGSGKTLVAAMAISCMKKLNPRKLAVFIVDRIPLAHQQAEYIKTQVPGLKVSVLAGDSNHDDASMMKSMNNLAEGKTDVLVLTHQIFLNILSDDEGVVRLSDTCLLIIDEAHRCQGNHPYNQIMRDHYVKLPEKFKPLVLALTASPAGEIGQKETMESLQDLLARLCCSPRMPVMSQDLARYTHKPETTYKLIPLTSLQQTLDTEIETFLKGVGWKLAEHGKCQEITRLSPQAPNYRGCLRQISGRCHDDENLEGYALSEFVMHLIGILEINNILGLKFAMQCLQECFEIIENESTPIERRKKLMLRSESAFDRLNRQVLSMNMHHFTSREIEKFSYLVEELKLFSRQVEQDITCRGIVFVHMRKTAFKFCEILLSYPDIVSKLNPKPFVGHGDGGTDGMEWEDEQKVLLKQFRSGRTKLLISTGVLEEGLDVPICNMVIRFNSLTTLRTHVQSRGRASRRANSKFILIFSDVKKYNDAQMVTVKENNMEQAMKLLHNTSQGMITQATRFACRAQKPSFSQDPSTTPNSVGRAGVHHRYEVVPTRTVKVSINLPSDGAAECRSAIMFFRQNDFEIKEMSKDAENTPTSMMFEIEYDEQENSSGEFLERLTKLWCSPDNDGGISESWLEHLDKTREKRTAKVNVIAGQSFSIGYFRRRNHFCRHWPTPQLEELRFIRVVFQHDLKYLLILFTIHEQSTCLYELEIQYSELQNLILVDRQTESTKLFLSLKNPPKLYKTNKGADWEVYLIGGDLLNVDSDDSDFEELESNEDELLGEDNIEQADDEDRNTGNDSDNESMGQNDDENVIHTGENDGTTSAHPILAILEDIKDFSRVPSVSGSRASFGRCLSYMISVSNADFDEMLTTVQSCGKTEIYFARVTEEERPLQDPSQVHNYPGLDDDVRYALHCLWCNHPSLLGRISVTFTYLLRDISKNTALASLEKLGSEAEEDLFYQPEETLSKILQTPNLRPKRFMAKHTPSHCALVKRLIVTPTRLLFGPEEILQNNRVLRNFEPSNFLCVNIRDEDFSMISGSSADVTVVLNYWKEIFDEGIEVCGDHYSFLGCSNSQLRSHSCWFVKSSAQPDKIRSWMGDFSTIRLDYLFFTC